MTAAGGVAAAVEEEAAAAVRLALAHARTAAGLLAGEFPLRRILVRDDAGAGIGAAAWWPWGRTAFLFGEPLAPPPAAAAVIAAADAACDAAGVRPLWLNVTAAGLPALRAAGFGPTKVGEECVVRRDSPDAAAWRGGSLRGIRKGCARSARAGVRVEELSSSQVAAQRTALEEVARRHAASKPQRRIAWWLHSPPPPTAAGPRRTWAAVHADRPIAVATAHPLGVMEADGSHRWTLAGFHRDPVAPPGTATALIAGVLDDLLREGVSAVSLGPAPALRCGEPTAGDHPLVRRAVAAWFRRGNGLFDARGLWQFKSRFCPDLEPLYACGRPRVSCRQAADFVIASGVWNASPARVRRRTHRDRRRPRTFGTEPR